MGAGAGPGAGASGLRVGSKTGCLIVGFRRGGIVVKTKRRAMIKLDKLPYLSNGLAESLGENFKNCKSRSTSQLLVGLQRRKILSVNREVKSYVGGHVMRHMIDNVIN